MIDSELLSSALTIVYGNDIYKPVIRSSPEGISSEYCINGVKIAIMMSMFDLRFPDLYQYDEVRKEWYKLW